MILISPAPTPQGGRGAHPWWVGGGAEGLPLDMYMYMYIHIYIWQSFQSQCPLGGTAPSLTDGRADGQMVGRTDRWSRGRSGGWSGGWTDGLADGRAGGRACLVPFWHGDRFRHFQLSGINETLPYVYIYIYIYMSHSFC